MKGRILQVKYPMYKVYCFLVILLAAFIAGAQANAANDEALIRKARAASNAAIAKHDVNGITQCLTPDVSYIIGRAKSFSGRDTVIATWKQLFATNAEVVYERIPAQIIISKNDTLAWETGTWKAQHSYSAGGNYSAMWCKRNGVWMTRAELFVSLEK